MVVESLINSCVHFAVRRGMGLKRKMQEIINESQNYEKLRRFPRYPIDVSVRVMTSGETGSASCCYGRGTEIGEGGMAVYIAREFEIGDTVNVQLTLPCTSYSIESVAHIRNRRRYCYGIEFAGLHQRDRDYLKLMCRGLALTQ